MIHKPRNTPKPKNILPCHICGADGNERVWTMTNAGKTLNFEFVHPLRIFSDAHRINGSEVAALVCKNCGNVEFFVNSQDFT